MSRDKDDRADGPSFAELVGKVRRLEVDTIAPPPRRTPLRQRPHGEPSAPIPDAWSDHDSGDEREEYQRNGVQHGVVRKLRRGQFPISDEVDLHGLTLAQARVHLARFLDHVRVPRLVCVRVIHGKGLSSPGFKAVLKPRVREWLRQDARVLAFAPAPTHDGGSGALYVLLRARS